MRNQSRPKLGSATWRPAAPTLPRGPVTMKRPGGRGERRRQLATSLVPPPQPVTLARLSCARRLRIGPSRSRSGRPGNSLGRSAVLREVQAWEERRIAEGRDGGGRPIGRGWKGEGHVGGGGPRAAGGAGRGPSGCGRGVKWGCDGRVGRGRCGRGTQGLGRRHQGGHGEHPVPAPLTTPPGRCTPAAPGSPAVLGRPVPTRVRASPPYPVRPRGRVGALLTSLTSFPSLCFVVFLPSPKF